MSQHSPGLREKDIKNVFKLVSCLRPEPKHYIYDLKVPSKWYHGYTKELCFFEVWEENQTGPGVEDRSLDKFIKVRRG